MNNNNIINKLKNRSQEILSELSQATGIRESTRTQYAKRLRHLEKICGDDIVSIFKNPDKSIASINSSIESPGARANAVAVILAVFKHCKVPEIKQDIRDRWSTILADLDAPATDAFTSGIKKTDLEWSEVFSKNDSLYKKATSKEATRADVKDALLSMFYVDVEPRRQEDYMRLYVKTTADPPPETSYVDFFGLDKGILHVEKYKTSKSLDSWVKELPKRLDEILKLSLKLEPRDYVFVGRDGLPYKTAGAWAKHHNSKLTKWFGKKANVLALRHARATSLNQDSRYSAKQRSEIARDMGHRLATNMAYAHVDTKESPDGSFTVSRFSNTLGRFVEYGCKPNL